MSDPAAPRLVDALDGRVTAFQTPKFLLADDLGWLDRLRALRAPVAAILHAARILEVLVHEALRQVWLGGPPGDFDLNQVLRLLVQYDCLTKDAYRLLDGLRDLGNAARHIKRKVAFDDADLGYALALRTLHWYFCEFPKGPGLTSVAVHNQPLDALLPSRVASPLAMLESAELRGPGFVERLRLNDRFGVLLMSPLLAAVLVERLLDGGRTDEAQAVLTAGLGWSSDDVRLRQLQGLLWSRTGRLAESCAWLEKIGPDDSAADEETQGILAGAYKRRAETEPARRGEWLAACHDRYVRGWRRSGERNPYLGINAAATALWLGLAGPGASAAAAVRDLVTERRRGLAFGGAARFLNCWDQLTLAEAHLLLREWDAAREAYREARERFPRQTKALEVAREQARKDLEALGQAGLLESIFPA